MNGASTVPKTEVVPHSLEAVEGLRHGILRDAEHGHGGSHDGGRVRVKAVATAE